LDSAALRSISANLDGPLLLSINEDDLAHLRLFRHAPRQVREGSVVAKIRRIVIEPRMGQDDKGQVEVHLLAEEAFRSLALAIRLVY